MNKQALIDAVAAQTGRPKSETGQTLAAFLAVIQQSVSQGESVPLPNFGTFKAADRAARAGRNPATGKAIQIAARRTVKFTAGKAFKEALNVKAGGKKAGTKKAAGKK